MSADENGQDDGDNNLPRGRTSSHVRVLKDQSTSPHLLSPSRPVLAINTTSAQSPYLAIAPPLDSDSIPSTSNTTSRPSRRHSRRVQWAINPTSATAPSNAFQVPRAENVAQRLSTLDELALDVRQIVILFIYLTNSCVSTIIVTICLVVQWLFPLR